MIQREVEEEGRAKDITPKEPEIEPEIIEDLFEEQIKPVIERKRMFDFRAFFLALIVLLALTVIIFTSARLIKKMESMKKLDSELKDLKEAFGIRPVKRKKTNLKSLDKDHQRLKKEIGLK